MSLTPQLGAPGIDVIQEGKYTLNRFFKVEAAAATPVASTQLSYIVGLDIGDPSFEETDVFHQGGGDERSKEKRRWSWSGSITVHKGKLATVKAQLLGLTWDTGNDTGIPFKVPDDFPHIHWEAVCRKKDNTDHLFTVLIQDMIIDSAGFSNPLDQSDGTINFHTYYPPIYFVKTLKSFMMFGLEMLRRLILRQVLRL